MPKTSICRMVVGRICHLPATPERNKSIAVKYTTNSGTGCIRI